MPLNLASPGIVVREVDLTIGRTDPSADAVGALVAPFAKGPVDVPVLVENEADLLQNFGEPYTTDKHYEHWLVASSYLSYGGSLRIVRSDDSDLTNGFSGAAASVKIKSLDDYNNKGYDENVISDVTVAARNPGSWSNGMKVAIIDAKADQILTMSTTSVGTFSASITDRTGTISAVGVNTVAISTASITAGDTVVSPGVVPEDTTVTSVGVGVITLSANTTSTQASTFLFDFGTVSTTLVAPVVGCGVRQAISSTLAGSGSTSVLDGHLHGIITEVGSGEVSVKVLAHVSAAGTVTEVDYQPGGVYAFSGSGSVAIHTAGQSVAYGSTSVSAQKDWFDQQKITLSSGTSLFWNNLADRPSTTNFASARNSRFDEVHFVIIDDKGTVSGNSGTILEKHLSLSKAKNAEFSLGSPSNWRKYLATNSRYIFGGSSPSGIVTTAYTNNTNFTLDTDIGWDQDTDGVQFAATGATTVTLGGGKNYDGTANITASGALTSTIGNLSSGYELFENSEEFAVDFLLMGSANYSKENAQALANKLISVAATRQDALAFISPYRLAFLNDSSVGSVTVNSAATITDNVIGFYSPISSSSYGVFDSGYKYMYDKFADTFRYVPLNGDIAGLCARNDINNFPWFSPAGTVRGAILNAVKLAYNPSKAQRDKLYSNRINSVIFSPGAGITLFGDKTGLAKSSAFDRINVRRLFIYLEKAISAAARDQLFEFNDETTRTSFVNVVEPFLRDVQAKRGIYDFRVICDETNNTAAIIDNNEFVADIFIKPARSINFVGLTFVATRTGVSFEEIIGTV